MRFEVDSTMADERLDFAASKLPCTKTNDLCSDDLDSAVKDDKTHQIVDRNVGFGIDGFDESEPLIGLPLATEESFSLMAEREKELLPRDDYLSRLRSGGLDLGLRRQALDWVWKANDHHNFGPYSICLCVNFIDRFLSVFTIPRNKDWAVQLLAVACFSLATKLMETIVPPPVDLQVGGEGKYVFEGKTIQRMELLVLNTLNWRMGACTPCTFIDYFLRKTNDDHHFPSVWLMAKSFELILSTVRGIDFLEFRPSEVAAAVALSVSVKIHGVDIHKAMSCFINVEQARVLKCVELIQDLAVVGGSGGGFGGGLGTQLVPQSPNGVLETACLSYKSDDLTVGSCGNFSHSNRDTTKRRKLDKQQPPPSSSSSQQQEEDLPK